MVGPVHPNGNAVERADRGHVSTLRRGDVRPVTEMAPVESYACDVALTAASIATESACSNDIASGLLSAPSGAAVLMRDRAILVTDAPVRPGLTRPTTYRPQPIPEHDIMI